MKEKKHGASAGTSADSGRDGACGVGAAADESCVPRLQSDQCPGADAGVSAPASTPAPPPSAPAQRSAADLEKLVAPIALYPDPLIATILPASVYPLEIVQAARFVANTNNLAEPGRAALGRERESRGARARR